MKLLAVLILIVNLIGCEDNPYPETAHLTNEVPRRPTAVPRPIGMIVDHNVEYSEGVRRDFKIKAYVPAPGKPDVVINGLPAGATFDGESLTVSWKPAMFDGNDPKDPTIKKRIYPITILLRSSDDTTGDTNEKLVNLVVFDVPQNLSVESRDQTSVYEGKTLVYKFSIDNTDYPNGPFSITTKDMPANSKIEQVSDTEFQMTFKPDHHHVIINENDDCNLWNKNCVTYKGRILVHNPANHVSEKEVQIRILDSRLDTKIVVPENLEQGLDVTYQVSAYDLNGEVPPKIEMVTPEPEFGKFITRINRDQENNSSVLNVSWMDIPPSYNGKSVNFKFKACTLDTNERYKNCEYDDFNIKVVVKDRKPPVIYRSEWAAGEIKYFNFGDYKSFNIDIEDGDRRWEKVKNVKIMPVEMQDFVEWTNGVLKVRFDKPGIHQFSIVAKSEYNTSSAQSFVAEVFEPNRSRILYFTDSTRDDEVKFYRDTMGEVQLMNPVLQALNERNLSGRDTLILGTGILQDKGLKETIAKALDKINDVVVASPLIENMPQKFIDELQQEHHISILGRYRGLPNLPALETMRFIARDEFETPTNLVMLKKTTTVESFNPLVFSVGVDRTGCEDVLDLTDEKKEARLKIGIICDRNSGGRYAILGTEFADLKLSEADTGLAAKWLQRMLTTSLNTKGAK